MGSWLTKLVDLEAPSGATLEHVSIGFRGALVWWFALAVAVPCAVLFWKLYMREPMIGRRMGRIGLAVLRTVALIAVLFLLTKPVLVGEYVGQRPRPIAVLLDNSQSMSLRDEGSAGTRVDAVRAWLKSDSARLFARLGEHGPVQAFRFGADLTPVAEPIALTADSPATAMAESVRQTALAAPGDPPAAVILATDGNDNASRLGLGEVAKRCGEAGVPLHIFGVGSAQTKLLAIRGLDVADVLFAEDSVSLPITLRMRGWENQPLELRAELGGRVVGRRDLSGRDGDAIRETLEFVPPKPEGEAEQTELKITLAAKNDPQSRHEVRRSVRVLEQRIKVLCIEDPPRWQYKYLQSTLLRDRRVAAEFYLTSADRKTLASGPPYIAEFPTIDKLFDYDLVILGDVPPDRLGREAIEAIRSYVSHGGGLVLIAGHDFMPAHYADTPLADAIPVVAPPFSRVPGESAKIPPFRPVLTTAGRQSEMMALAEDQKESLKIWQELPEWQWFSRASKIRPGATVLLAHPTAKSDDQPKPIVAMQHYGRGQSLILCGDETWRWRFNVGDKLFARFWGQVVYRLGLPHLVQGSPRAQLSLQHPKPVLGQPEAVYAHLLDDACRPLLEPRVAAKLVRTDAPEHDAPNREVLFEAVPGWPGEYRAVLANDAAGFFELRLDRPVSAVLAFQVQPPPHDELAPLGLDEASLREAAALSGGRFYREADLPQLVDAVKAQFATFTLRTERLLWNPLLLILIVGVLTVEWVVRKFYNLS